MPLELRNFANGGMDTDSSIENVAHNDYLASYNCRVQGTSEGEDGYITNIESTVALAGTRPTGLNKAIGGDKFETIRKALYFIYNSQGFHQIAERDYDTLAETILFTNKTNSGGVDILSLDPQYYVTDIKLIGDTYVVFTDNNMQVGYFNLQRLRSGGYGTLTQDDLLLIKAQLLVPPLAVYGDDTSRSANLLSGKLFQFRTQYVYLDDEYSAHSTISKRPTPTEESTPAIGTDVSKNNNIQVSTGIGTNRVKRVVVSARIGDGDWFTIRDLNRTDILAITDTEIDLALQIYEAYDPITGLYTFTFYNDGLYNNINVLETDLLADSIPLKAGTLELLNGNVLALADLTEGYARPNPDVTIGISAYEPEIDVDIPVEDDALTIVSTREERVSGGTIYFRVYIYFKGLPKTGDVITIVTENAATRVPYSPAYTYTVPAGQEDNLVAVLNSLGASMGRPFSVRTVGDQVEFYFSTRRNNETPDGGIEHLQKAYRDLANAGTGASKSVSALKSNSSYQLAFAHYDKWGRAFPISTDDRYIIKTQSYSQLQGLASQVTWSIAGTAPTGAVSGQWLLSTNNTHQSVLFVVAKTATVTTNYITLNINSLKEFNEGNEASVLNYDYTVGDRVTFHYYDNTGKVWLDNIDVEVVGFEIEVTTDVPPVTNYLLKVRRPTGLDTTAIAGKNILIEIYTPKKRTIENSDGEVSLAPTVFYEIGEQINIVDGVYQTTSGIIRGGDVYFKTRQLENSITSTLEVNNVEDFNFSDFYPSAFTSYGRPRSYYDVDENENKKASIRYSDVFRLGSAVNGITRFYPERLYGEGDGETSSNFGAIEKIRQRDNYLICIQNLKIGHIPVFQSILEDQVEQNNVAISDKILDKIRYLQSGKYGMGGAKESYAESRNGTVYFIDFNNSEPIRDGYNGVQSISGKMSKYFKRTLQEAKNAGKKVIGWFDEYNNEYVVAIEQEGDILQEFAFSTDNWRKDETYTVVPATLLTTVAPTKGTVNINTTTGIATYQSYPGESGADSYTFSFVVDGVTKTKTKYYTILPGDTTPNSFFFSDVTGQSLSSVATSNPILVDGVNVPVAISITGGTYSVNGGAYTSSSGYVSQNDSITVRHTSSASYNTATNTVLTIGGVSDTFTTTTITQPDAFAFTDQTDVALSTVTLSDIETITGLTGATPISVTVGEYRINGGAWTSVAGTITNNQTVQLRVASSASYNTAVSAILTIGGISDTWSVTTIQDTTPDAFGFSTVFNTEKSTLHESGSITITGLGASAPISVVDGEYSINGGAYTSASGTFPVGGTIKVRRTSSASNFGFVTVSVTIGGVVGVWTLVTMPSIDATNSTAVTPVITVKDSESGGVTVFTDNYTTFTGEFGLINLTLGTLSIILSGEDLSANNFTINGVVTAPTSVVGTTYTYAGITKGNLVLLLT